MPIRVAVMKRLVGMTKALQRKIMLVPVGIDKWQPADIIQVVQVFFCQCQRQSAKILGELGFGPPADNKRADCRAGQ